MDRSITRDDETGSTVALCPQPEVTNGGHAQRHPAAYNKNLWDKDCFMHFIKIVFCFGIPRNTSVGNGQNVRNNAPYSAYVGPIVLAIVMISISSSQEIAIYVSDHSKMFVQIVNSLYIVLSTGVLVVLKWKQTGRRSDDYIEKGRPNETILAMWLFWVFGAALDVMEVIYISSCATELMKNGLENTTEIVFDIFYHVIRPIYKLALVIFCSYYMKQIFNDTVRYGLMIILATMLSIWVELLFDEANHHEVHNIISNLTDAHEENVSTIHCSGNHSEIFEQLELGRSICVPSMIEFTLLVVECVIHWFNRCKSEQDGDEPTSGAHGSERNEAGSHSHGGQLKARLRCGFGSAKKYNNCRACNMPNANTRYKLIRRYFSSIIYVFSYPFNVGLSVAFVAMSWHASNEKAGDNFRIVFCLYSIGWYICNIGVTFSAIAVTKYFDPKHRVYKGLNGLEHLLLFALLGPILMHSFALISIFHQWISPEYPDFTDPWKHVIRELFNTFQILIQVPLIFLAKRITTKLSPPESLPTPTTVSVANNDNVDSSSDDQLGHSPYSCHSVRRLLLLSTIFHLAIANAAYWFADSFVDPQEKKLSFNTAYYSHMYWPIVSGIFAPLQIFYRFHSMLLLFGAWRGLAFSRYPKNT